MVVNGWMRDEKHSQTSIHQHTSPMTICLSRWNASFLSFKEMASILAKKQANIKLTQLKYYL